MHSANSWLDRFCARHQNLAIPNLMLYIVIGNIAVYLMDMFSRSSFSAMLTFSPYYIFHHFQLWRLISFIFVPSSSNLLVVAIALYFYYFIGSALEREWGSAKFTVFYGLGVLLNILVGIVLSLVYGTYQYSVGVDMYYLNMSLFFAFATLYPDLSFLLFFIIPLKAKWLAWFDAAIFAWGILSSLFLQYWPGVILPLAAILNYFIFFWNDFSSRFERIRYRTSRQTLNFKRAAREAKQNKGYLHKCAVCGITDADDPNMEFRYCSKCNGYYCYCMNHINNHVHIQ